ncbi:unnamed protein product, partial [Mesorhabditis spiculigera]
MTAPSGKPTRVDALLGKETDEEGPVDSTMRAEESVDDAPRSVAVNSAVSLDRGIQLQDGDILLWDEPANTVVVARINLKDVLEIDLSALVDVTPEKMIQTCLELGHAVVDKAVMGSVMRTHAFEGIEYTFIPGAEVIPVHRSTRGTPFVRINRAMRMMQLSDSMFPVGSFSFSNGLESAVAQGIVTGGPSLREFVLGRPSGRDVRRDRRTRSAPGRDRRDRTQAQRRSTHDEYPMGKQLAELGGRLAGETLFNKWLAAIASGETPGTYPVGPGIAAEMGSPEEDAFTITLRTQEILFEVNQSAGREYAAVRDYGLDDMSNFAPMIDILAAVHVKAHAITPEFIKRGTSVLIITNDVVTTEDAKHVRKALKGVLVEERIVGVETGACPHTAVREDLSMNLAAVEDMEKTFPDTDVVFIESGGDNLTLTFSPALVDFFIYVIDVAAGDKIPRKNGPGISQSDILVINKTDLAPYVNADLGVMDRDSGNAGRRQAFVFTNCMTGKASRKWWTLSCTESSFDEEEYQDQPKQAPAGKVGKTGVLEMRFVDRGDKTILRACTARHRVLVQQALYWDEALPTMPCVYVISTSGSVLQGDRLFLTIEMEPGSLAHVTTQSATKVHRMDANHASQLQKVVLAENSYLELMPG